MAVCARTDHFRARMSANAFAARSKATRRVIDMKKRCQEQVNVIYRKSNGPEGREGACKSGMGMAIPIGKMASQG